MSSTWTTTPGVAGAATNYKIQGLPSSGVIYVRVRPVTAVGRTGAWTAVQHILTAKTTAPAAVAGLSAAPVQGGLMLTWSAAVGTDYAYTELRQGATWAAGLSLAGSAPTRISGTSFLWAWPTQGSYTIWAAHVDTSGNVSAPVSGSATVGPSSLVQWTGGVYGRPDSANNLICKSSFEDGSAGAWTSFSGGATGSATNTGTTWSRHLWVNSRDNYEVGSDFPVVVGEKIYVAADIKAGALYTNSVGLAFIDSSGSVINWVSGISSPAGASWTRRSGSLVVPSGAVFAKPWIQINGAGGAILEEHWFANLYIGRQELGATVGATFGLNISGLAQTSDIAIDAATTILSASVPGDSRTYYSGASGVFGNVDTINPLTYHNTSGVTQSVILTFSITGFVVTNGSTSRWMSITGYYQCNSSGIIGNAGLIGWPNVYLADVIFDAQFHNLTAEFIVSVPDGYYLMSTTFVKIYLSDTFNNIGFTSSGTVTKMEVIKR
jgi:hypothetical protein